MHTPFARRAGVLLACLFSFLLSGCQAPTSAAMAAQASADEGSVSTELYVCPMHPHIQQHGPGTCPICSMQLVRRTLDPAAAQAGNVAVRSDLQQSLGVRIGTATREDIRPRLRVPARVVADASQRVRIGVRVDGWVERLHVRAETDPVEAGQVVAEVYAPALIQAQNELFLSDQARQPAIERLRQLGIAQADIDRVLHAGKAQRRLPIRAPQSGVVRRLGVLEGDRITTAMVLLEIEGVDQVWAEVGLTTAQRLQLGDAVSGRFSLPGAPERIWRGKASYLSPLADPVTQRMTLRIPLPNRKGLLPVGGWLDGLLLGETREKVLLVPAEAVLRRADEARIVLALDEDRFVPQPVRLGEHYGDRIEILSGLSAGARIVLSGQFLLDSEADLRSGLPAATHQHGESEAAAPPAGDAGKADGHDHGAHDRGADGGEAGVKGHDDPADHGSHGHD